MRTIYLYVNRNGFIRKIAVDMAYLFSHNKIRLPKYYFEEGLFLKYCDLKDASRIESYFLSKDKIVKQDKDFFYFDFPFKLKQVLDISV